MKEEAPISLAFNGENVTLHTWHTAEIIYDLSEKCADILLDGELYEKRDILADAPLGLSYLHVQTLAEKQDYQGTLIRLFEKK